jgi:hypothetical protein
MFSPRNLLTQEPAAIKAAVLAVLAALITTGVIGISAEAVAAWGLAIELVLGLLYVRSVTTSKVFAAEQQAEALRTQRAEIGAYLADVQAQAATPAKKAAAKKPPAPRRR